MEEPSKAIINCLLIIGFDHNYNTLSFYENMTSLLTQLWFGTPNSFPKFKSIFLKAMGYSYRLTDQLTPEECLRKMKIINSPNKELSKSELLELITDCCNSPLPRNGHVLWEALVGTQPIKRNSSDTKTYYPLLFRVHHGVADGVSLLKLVIGVFADSPHIEIVSSGEYKQIAVTKSKVDKTTLLYICIQASTTFFKQSRYILKRIFTAISILVLYPAVCFIQLVLKCNDSNILHGPALTGQKVLALTIEDNPKYIQKIKLIKKQVRGTSFADILLTAYTASLRDYFIKKSKYHPEFISTLIPLLPGSLDLQYMVPGQLNENSISFKNGYTFVLPTLPLFIPLNNSESKPLLKRLKMIKNEMEALKKAIDYKVNYFMMRVAGAVFPQPLIRLILSGSHCTTLASVIAGPQNITFGGGIHSLESLAFWVPHVKNIGVSFSVLTYCNRLHIGLSVDKALISQQSDAQSIVDGVFRYLDDIEEELGEANILEKN